MYVIRYGRFSAECVIDFLPVDFLCVRAGGKRSREN
jgi:hypothetical protein